jgi:hypothetical protein
MSKDKVKGRKPSAFRKKIDSRLALLNNNSSFSVGKHDSKIDINYLQNLITSYIWYFEKRSWKMFRTKRSENGVRIYRVR